MYPAIDKTTYISPNHNPRPDNADISALLIHSCEGTRESSLPWLCKPRSPTHPKPVSSHYYVCRDGDVYQLVDDDQEAWHAGKGRYGGVANISPISLGIELEHKKGGPGYTAVQLESAGDLCRAMIDRYDIPQSWVLAHRWWAPNRKFDPTDWDNGPLRSWIAALYAAPLHEPPIAPAELLRTYRVTVPNSWVRAAPTTSSRHSATLGLNTKLSGWLVNGEAHQDNALWLKLSDGAGYVWAGQVREVPR